MRTFLLVIFILGTLSILAILGVVVYELISKNYKYKIRNLLKIAICPICICILTTVADFSIENKQEKVTVTDNTTSQESEKIKGVRAKQDIYAKLLDGGKSYEQMNQEERANAYQIVDLWNDFEENFKEKYKDKMNILKKDREKFIMVQTAKLAAKEAKKNKALYDTGITYNQLARTPNKFKDKKVTFVGKVIQVIEDENGEENDLRIAVDGNLDNILYVGYNPKIIDTRILEDDNVIVRGISLGIYSYESTMGAKVSIPSVWVEQIELNK